MHYIVDTQMERHVLGFTLFKVEIERLINRPTNSL